MKLTTLVLSGGSTKVPAYIGVFRALKEEGIVDDKLTGIKHIIVCSVGMLYGLLLLLQVSDSVIETSMMSIDFAVFLDIDSITVTDLLFNLGLFDNAPVTTIIKTILREKWSKDDMTLQELYDLTKIKLSVKVVNSSESKIEYVSHENYPDISILTLLQMTTAIPFFFKPITYNGCLYVDGGTAGGYPCEIAGDNFLGIHIKGPWKRQQSDITDMIPLISHMLSMTAISPLKVTEDERTILLPLNIHFTDFSLSVDKKQQLIDEGYRMTKEHIDKYKITNELLHPGDKDRSGEDGCSSVR